MNSKNTKYVIFAIIIIAVLAAIYFMNKKSPSGNDLGNGVNMVADSLSGDTTKNAANQRIETKRVIDTISGWDSKEITDNATGHKLFISSVSSRNDLNLKNEKNEPVFALLTIKNNNHKNEVLLRIQHADFKGNSVSLKFDNQEPFTSSFTKSEGGYGITLEKAEEIISSLKSSSVLTVSAEFNNGGKKDIIFSCLGFTWSK
jgi:preprotein translocase subunit SecF